jgi:hypothetical protein
MPAKVRAQAAKATQMKKRGTTARNASPSALDRTDVLTVYIPRGNTRLQYGVS